MTLNYLINEETLSDTESLLQRYASAVPLPWLHPDSVRSLLLRYITPRLHDVAMYWLGLPFMTNGRYLAQPENFKIKLRDYDDVKAFETITHLESLLNTAKYFYNNTTKRLPSPPPVHPVDYGQINLGLYTNIILNGVDHTIDLLVYDENDNANQFEDPDKYRLATSVWAILALLLFNGFCFTRASKLLARLYQCKLSSVDALSFQVLSSNNIITRYEMRELLYFADATLIYPPDFIPLFLYAAVIPWPDLQKSLYEFSIPLAVKRTYRHLQSGKWAADGSEGKPGKVRPDLVGYQRKYGRHVFTRLKLSVPAHGKPPSVSQLLKHVFTADLDDQVREDALTWILLNLEHVPDDYHGERSILLQLLTVAAAHRDCPAWMLHALQKSGPQEAYTVTTLRNPQSTPDDIVEVLTRKPDCNPVWILLAALVHPNCPDDLLFSLIMTYGHKVLQKYYPHVYQRVLARQQPAD